MTSQNAWTLPIGRPAAAFKAMTDGFHLSGERTVAGHNELAECAFGQARQNIDAMFDSLRKMSEATSPINVASLYLEFLVDASRKHDAQVKAIGEILVRSGKAAARPLGEMMAPAGTLPSPVSSAAADNASATLG